ncbi:hypothetical protein [Streptomyces sp. NPDC002851]
MGRSKPNKPRRQRGQATYTLRQLQPPGELYTTWFHVRADEPTALPEQGLSDDAVDLMKRLRRIAPYYGGQQLPEAAVMLDIAIDVGALGILTGPDGGDIIPLDQAGAALGADGDDVRASLHRLHAVGALLTVQHEEHTFVRIVAKRPESPGDEWILEGDAAAQAVPRVCVPNGAQADLAADEFAALMYMRAKAARLEEPDALEFGRFAGTGGTARAHALFAAVKATKWLEHRGCEACPAGHLCTRSPESDPVSA